MELATSLLKLAAGIGLFMFAMYLIEESIKNLSGRRFKLFLQRLTKNRFTAAAGGAIVTAVLQSSSMVSLMVLAFVGAGVFSMQNALAVILGANLGTTLDSWVVATLGFNMDIQLIAYPAICIGGILMMALGKKTTFKYVSYFLFGFGLLFIGLSFMKTAMETQVKSFDVSQYADMPLIVFLGIGFVLTLLVQSSSVTMALTLSALHTGAIAFAPAAAMIIGSETGTNIKILLIGISGNAVKKRVGLGNFLFNLTLTVVAFALIHPILLLITDVFHISDPLIGLVTFASLNNFLGVSLFLPFLGPYTRFLERFFKKADSSPSAFIAQANVNEPVTAIDLFRKESALFVHNVMLFNVTVFEIDKAFLQDNPQYLTLNTKSGFLSKETLEQYEMLRIQQGEIQAFYLSLRPKLQEERDTVLLNQTIAAVRSAMYAAKCIKDIGKDINNLHHSSKDYKFGFFQEHQRDTQFLYRQLSSVLRHPNDSSFSFLLEIYHEIARNYDDGLNDFYQKAPEARLETADITTVLNFNRELFTSNKAILMAVKDMALDEKHAQEFNEVPVYRT